MKIDLKNKKTKIIIKIICWFILAVSLFLFLFFENRRYQKLSEAQNIAENYSVDFEYLKKSLLNNDFEYLYIVADNDVLSYKGKKVNNLYSGTYKKNGDEKEYSNKNILDDKYKYLLMDNVFDLFDNEYVNENNRFIYENDNLYVKIRVSINNIVNIEINDKETIYQLEITNISNFDIKGSE